MSIVGGKHALHDLLLFSFVGIYRLGIVVDVSGTGGVVGVAGGVIGSSHILRAVINAGLTPSLRFVPAMNAEPRMGGDDLAAFGASFQ